MIELTEPQTWTTIGVLAATLLGTITLVSTMFLRTITAQFSGLRSEIGGLRAEMNARFVTVDVRFDAMNTKIDGLDRDVQLLMSREFGKERD